MLSNWFHPVHSCLLPSSWGKQFSLFFEIKCFYSKNALFPAVAVCVGSMCLFHLTVHAGPSSFKYISCPPPLGGMLPLHIVSCIVRSVGDLTEF